MRTLEPGPDATFGPPEVNRRSGPATYHRYEDQMTDEIMHKMVGTRGAGARLQTSLKLGLIFTLAIVTAGLSGCGGGGGSNSSEPEQTEPEKSPEELAAEAEEQRLDHIKRQFDLAKKQIRKAPSDFFNHIDNLQGILVGASGTKYEEPLKEAIAEQNKALEDFADKQLDGLLTEAKTYLEKEDWYEAEQTLERFEQNAAAFSNLPAWERYQDELERVRIASDAEHVSQTVLGRAAKFRRQGELARALGILIGYPEVYSGTSYHAQVQKTVEEYLVDYKLELAEREKADAIPFVDLEIDEYLSNFDVVGRAGEDDVWSGVDGVVEGSNESDDPNNRAIIVLGTDEWEDWVVEFSVKYKDGKLRLGITNGLPTYGGSEKQFATYSFPDVEEGEWVQMRVEVREGMFNVINVDDGTPMKEDVGKAYQTGGFAVWLFPGQQVFLKDIRYKVLTQVELDEDGNADPDGGDDEDQ
ncbi:MAG: hypothetical protein AAF488_16255 [Planctomycetota bacterium]